MSQKEKGLLKATKLSGKWYYSVKTLLETIASIDEKTK